MKKSKYLLFALLFTTFFSETKGQSLRLDHRSRYNDFVDRLDVIYGCLGNYSSSIKKHDSKALGKTIFQNYSSYTQRDKEEARHFFNQYDFEKHHETVSSVLKYTDTSNVFYSLEEEDAEGDLYELQQPIFGYFYKNPHHFLSIDATGLTLRADPILDLGFGQDRDNKASIFKNTRGLRVSGYVDDKIYIYTEILENQSSFLNYINEFIIDQSAIPGNGLFKNFESGVIKNFMGYDYLNAQGYVGLPISKSVAIEFGHSRHFLGNGIRSLLLSDFSNNYFYLKFNTRVWKLNYQNIFAELNALANPNLQGDQLIPKKYMANHYLSVNLRKNLEVGLFETVVFSRENHFEFQYLNPIILYRTVEHSLGSPDNVILGTNVKWNPWKGISFYGQFALDEFNLSFAKKDGWWANKFAFQGGIKYFNVFGIEQLYGQIEVNYIRPFTYSHDEGIAEYPDYSVGNYSHYNQSLAHPLGANLKEVLIDLKYRPTDRISLSASLSLMKKGLDIDGKNFGGNILLVNTSRWSEFGNTTLQGNERTVKYANVRASYEIFKNYYFDINGLYRKASYSEALPVLNTVYIGLGLRANISSEDHLF